MSGFLGCYLKLLLEHLRCGALDQMKNFPFYADRLRCFEMFPVVISIVVVRSI